MGRRQMVKAAAFGAVIRRFESFRPSQNPHSQPGQADVECMPSPSSRVTMRTGLAFYITEENHE
jgi:hypothetical protein